MTRAPAELRRVADLAAKALAGAGVPEDGDGVAVAVSGGADSLALLHALRVLSGPRRWRLAVVTVDHGLRPGSAADAAFVADHAKALGLPARVLTLTAAGLAWRDDPTNATDGPLRNRVRHHLLPLLEQLRPGATQTLARTATLAADDRTWLDPLVAKAVDSAAHRIPPRATLPEGAPQPGGEGGARPDGTRGEGGVRPDGSGGALDVATLAGLPVALGRRVVRVAAARAGIGAPDAAATDRVLALAGAADGAEATWPGGVAVRDGPSVRLALPAD